MLDELATLKVNLSVLEDEYRTKGQDWSSIENRMKEETKELEEKLLQAAKSLENGGREREKLESSLDIARQEIDQHKTKSADLETMKNELEQVQLNQVIFSISFFLPDGIQFQLNYCPGQTAGTDAECVGGSERPCGRIAGPSRSIERQTRRTGTIDGYPAPDGCQTYPAAGRARSRAGTTDGSD